MSDQHDPLCHRGAVWEDMTPTNCVGCIVIGRVRADERERAAERVTALCAHTKYEGCQPCVHDDCVAAVRGEA